MSRKYKFGSRKMKQSVKGITMRIYIYIYIYIYVNEISGNGDRENYSIS
jgi:hypothetical protein